MLTQPGGRVMKELSNFKLLSVILAVVFFCQNAVFACDTDTLANESNIKNFPPNLPKTEAWMLNSSLDVIVEKAEFILQTGNPQQLSGLKEGSVMLDVGRNIDGNGKAVILDHHHCVGGRVTSAAGLCVDEQDKIRKMRDAFNNVVIHENPDLDAIMSVYLVSRILRGNLSDNEIAFARYVEKNDNAIYAYDISSENIKDSVAVLFSGLIKSVISKYLKEKGCAWHVLTPEDKKILWQKTLKTGLRFIELLLGSGYNVEEKKGLLFMRDIPAESTELRDLYLEAQEFVKKDVGLFGEDMVRSETFEHVEVVNANNDAPTVISACFCKNAESSFFEYLYTMGIGAGILYKDKEHNGGSFDRVVICVNPNSNISLKTLQQKLDSAAKAKAETSGIPLASGEKDFYKLVSGGTLITTTAAGAILTEEEIFELVRGSRLQEYIGFQKRTVRSDKALKREVSLVTMMMHEQKIKAKEVLGLWDNFNSRSLDDSNDLGHCGRVLLLAEILKKMNAKQDFLKIARELDDVRKGNLDEQYVSDGCRNMLTIVHELFYISEELINMFGIEPKQAVVLAGVILGIVEGDSDTLAIVQNYNERPRMMGGIRGTAVLPKQRPEELTRKVEIPGSLPVFETRTGGDLQSVSQIVSRRTNMPIASGPQVTIFRGADSKVVESYTKDGFIPVPFEAMMEKVEGHIRTDGQVYIDDLVLHRGALSLSGNLGVSLAYGGSKGNIMSLKMQAQDLLKGGVTLLSKDDYWFYNESLRKIVEGILNGDITSVDFLPSSALVSNHRGLRERKREFMMRIKKAREATGRDRQTQISLACEPLSILLNIKWYEVAKERMERMSGMSDAEKYQKVLEILSYDKTFSLIIADFEASVREESERNKEKLMKILSESKSPEEMEGRLAEFMSGIKEIIMDADIARDSVSEVRNFSLYFSPIRPDIYRTNIYGDALYLNGFTGFVKAGLGQIPAATTNYEVRTEALKDRSNENYSELAYRNHPDRSCKYVKIVDKKTQKSVITMTIYDNDSSLDGNYFNYLEFDSSLSAEELIRHFEDFIKEISSSLNEKARRIGEELKKFRPVLLAYRERKIQEEAEKRKQSRRERHAVEQLAAAV